MNCPLCTRLLDPYWIDLDQGEWGYVNVDIYDLNEKKNKRWWQRCWPKFKRPKIYSRQGYFCPDCDFLMFDAHADGESVRRVSPQNRRIAMVTETVSAKESGE